MNLLQFKNASKAFGPKILFQDGNFSINQGEHVGFIGANGAGKSTLFRVLVGQMELDQGEIIRSQQLRIAYLEQESDWDLSQNAQTILTSSSEMPLWKLKHLGLDLGLKDADFLVPLKDFSGGYRMRFKILQMLGQEPNLMLLDEPTNFLDLETILILERFLQNYQGAYLLISHDREFLRRTTDHILEIEQGELTKFPGDIDDYFEQKELLRSQLEKQALAYEAKRKSVQDFVDRFGAKATKAKQAQSRLKRLDKMEKVEIKPLNVKARIPIPAPVKTGKEVVVLEGASWGYGERTILHDVHLRLLRGDHLGVVGYNGAGKSTLLKGLAEKIPLQKGTMKYGMDVKFGYFSQHSTDSLDVNHTVLESLQSQAHASATLQDILNIAGALLFSGDDLSKKIRLCSGGEKSRVALGKILLLKAPVLLLDEPTNHLDFDTVEALTQALSHYEGTLVVVSHDRGFIARVASKILQIESGQAKFYPGTYEEYLWSMEKGVFSLEAVSASTPSESLALGSFDKQAEPQKLNTKHEQRRLEKEILQLQREIKKLELDLDQSATEQKKLTEELLNASGSSASQIALNLSQVSKKIMDLEEDLLERMQELEERNQELSKLGNKL